MKRVFGNTKGYARNSTRGSKCVRHIEVVKAQWLVIIGVRICLVWSGGVICCRRNWKRFDTGVQRVRNSELRRRRVFSRFLIVSRRVSGGFRVRFVPGMCVSVSFSWKSACVCKFCANAISRENFCAFCHPSCAGHRFCPLGRFFRLGDVVRFGGSCLQWESMDP